jgi:hypothetical protein
MHHCGAYWCGMKTEEGSVSQSGRSVERLSISLAATEKASLEKIAADKKVSLAWVVRDAVSQYLKSEGRESVEPNRPSH